MKYFFRITLFYLFIFCNASYSQRSIPKTIVNQNGIFEEGLNSPEGNHKKGIMTFANGDKIIGEWRNDTLHGLSKIIYKDGYIEQGRWRKGVLKEKYDLLEFYETTNKIICVKQSLNNKNNGKLINYSRGGDIISEEHYLNGKIFKKIEYENDFDKRIKVGAIKREVIYDGDLATYISYLDNGKLTMKSSISTGLSEGWETYHNRNGVLISRSLYKNGIIISDETYFENGTLKSLNDDKVCWEINEKGEKTKYINKITKKGFIFFGRPSDNKNFLKWEGEIDIIKNSPKGNGTLYFKDGDKIKGLYNGTNFEGLVEYYFNDGDVLKGLFKNDSFNGDGTYTFKNGNVYKGNFKNSLFDGYGKLFYNNVVIKEGIWENGKLVKDYNKDIASTNTKEKSSGHNKKHTSPPLHLSTSELRAWYDSKDGQKYLNDSGLLDDFVDRLYSSASRMSNNNSNSNSNSSQKKVFICSDSDGCCKSVITSNSKPADGICNDRKTLKAGQIGHRWNEVGQQGNKQFKCNKCFIVVNTQDSPKGGGCCSVGGCSGGHSWSEVK